MGNLIKLNRQDRQLQINYYIGTVNNLQVGASISGIGLGNINNEINYIEQCDFEMAKALEKLYDIDEIKKDILELTTIIAEYYKSSSKEKDNRKRKIKDKLDSIKNFVEVISTLIPFYNIIAEKFGFPIIPM